MKALKILTISAVVLVVACGCSEQPGAGAGVGKGGGGMPVPVTVALVETKDVPLEVRTFGNVEPVASIGIKAQVGGELIGVSFEEGQEVKRGDLLFSIQPRLFDTQLAAARANLERDRALAAAAELNLKRQESLDARGSGVKEELEKARAQAGSTAATAKADEALVLIAETQVGYTTIESPIEGRTGSIRLRPGNLIKAGDDEPLTTVVQLDPIHVAFALPEQHLEAIRKGMAGGGEGLAVTARDARDGRVLGEGRLVFVANTVDRATGTIGLKGEFGNKERALWPGAFLEVALRLGTDKGAVVVPSAAVTASQQGPRLYVVKADGTAEVRPVRVLRSAGSESLIGEGVKAGETVVVVGQSRIVPGGKVIAEKAGKGGAR
ncbi:MAG: membrane fusion protein, multidrug efflux system [Verrucomicrobia bacterium]|jgi:multidrug efflux system membrane fusion protein|nr:MAG: membrane fusion protein, multidrug efflux system [Verrucomicrobiota bacterium]